MRGSFKHPVVKNYIPASNTRTTPSPTSPRRFRLLQPASSIPVLTCSLLPSAMKYPRRRGHPEPEPTSSAFCHRHVGQARPAAPPHATVGREVPVASPHPVTPLVASLLCLSPARPCFLPLLQPLLLLDFTTVLPRRLGSKQGSWTKATTQ